MKRIDDMASRLPLLYREGPLVTGLLSQPAQQIEIAVEDALEVQRAHFFGDALDFDEVARLAALLDFVPEDWQTLLLFRPWVDSQRDAVIDSGGVTIDALVGFTSSYMRAFAAATGNGYASNDPTLVEFPTRRRYARPEVTHDTVPLSRFTITNRGLDASWLSLLYTGLEAGPESMPLLVNLATGDGLLYRGDVAPGQRLWILAGADGSVTAQLERDDVSARLVSISGIVPGSPWSPPQIHTPATALPLLRGENPFWFLPVAHYDERGLDRFLLALADLALACGRWDSATLDHAVFFMEPAVNLRMTWLEAEPASIELGVHVESVLRPPLLPGSADDARDGIVFALDEGVRRLKAAGVRSTVRGLSFSEVQGMTDFITGVLPLRFEEGGSSGGDRLPDKGGQFGVTSFGDSTFR